MLNLPHSDMLEYGGTVKLACSALVAADTILLFIVLRIGVAAIIRLDQRSYQNLGPAVPRRRLAQIYDYRPVR